MEIWELENLEQLQTAAGNVDLTEAEKRIMDWLAGWDHNTTSNLCSIFRKIRLGS